MIQEPIQPVQVPPPAKGRSSNTLKVGLIVALCLALAVPVIIAMAAASAPKQQDPLGLTAGASEAPTTQSSAKPDEKTGDHNGLKGLKGFKGFDLGRGGGGPGRGPITIRSIVGSNLGLGTDDGWTRTITVESTTTITKAGQPFPLADLKVGDEIRFSQKKNDDGTYTITAIVVPTPRAGGKVTAVTDTTISIDVKGDIDKVITVNGSTKYQVGTEAATKADVTVGDWIDAQGTVSGDTFTAVTVTIRPDVAGGVVTAKTDNSITVKGRDDKTTVIHVDSKTKFKVLGKDPATIADIKVGDWVGASGTKRADGSLDAQVVGGMTPKVKTPKAPASSSKPS